MAASEPRLAGGPPSQYRGRFAPSPTGDLHAGSLLTALGSWLDARARGGEWLVRMEDLDQARQVPGAEDRILGTLEACGLVWDGPVRRQRRRLPYYAAALQQLTAMGWVFSCGCTRRDLALLGHGGPEGPVYPGTCRDGMAVGRVVRSQRLRVPPLSISFHDRIQGRYRQHLARDVGDFVLRRAEGYYAYHLAVVVDDAEQGVTDVVRGADLLASTPRQIHIQQLLGLSTPVYAHLPLVRDAQGRKLSKQLRSMPVNPADPIPALARVLTWLGQPLPATLPDRPGELLAWAVARWRLERVPRQLSQESWLPG